MPSIADPLGGSYFIEALTDELDDRISSMMSDVAAAGGFVTALRDGLLQSHLDEASYLRQREIDSGERIVVGLNAFRQVDEQTSVKAFRIDEVSTQRQIDKLSARKARRDLKAVGDSLSALTTAAQSDVNLIEPILDCFRLGVTIGELCESLRGVFGTWRDEGVLF
jgi:methylmalonyl-CoA mutase N-terminal domain/subunit